MIDCPSCGGGVPADATIGSVAQCPACETLFDVQAQTDTAEPSPAAPKTVRYLPVAPDGVFITPHGNGLELRLPWNVDLNIGGHLLQLGTICLFIYPALHADSLAVSGVLLAFAALMLYTWVYFLCNSTTVLVGPRGIEVSHGPLPSFSFGGTYSMNQLRPLSVQTVEKGLSYRSRRTVYELHAGPGGTKILSDWNHRAPIAFVRDCIELVADRPLDGVLRA